MDKKSFYDADYIIEINEKRQEQYKSEYDKILGRISNLLIIYSAISLLLIPMCEDVWIPKCSAWYRFCFVLFGCLFLISFINGLRFFYPKDTSVLSNPSEYYGKGREALQNDPKYKDGNGKVDEAKIDIILKASYAKELVNSIDGIYELITHKQGLYERAFAFSIWSIIPYIVCIVFHMRLDNRVQKVEIENINKCRIFVVDTLGNKENKFDTSMFKNFVQYGKE